MFTGIIRHLGTIAAFVHERGGARLTLASVEPAMDLTQGESIAVNGVCLTAIPGAGGEVHFDLSAETLSRTTLGNVAAGDRVNLERALTLEDRLGGHLVQGHVDTVGTLLSKEEQEEFAVYRWSFPQEYSALIVEKGSIAVDGISLTIIDPDETSFGVALIPETLTKTNLQALPVGGLVNLEFDVIAKMVQRMLAPYVPSTSVV